MASEDFKNALAGSAGHFGDIEISAEQEKARKSRETRGKSILPAAAFSPSLRERVVSALVSLQGGLAASRGVTDPFTAALSGIAGSAVGPTPQALANQRAQQEAEARLAQIDALPIDEISPALSQRFPELAGMPFAMVNKIAPLLQRQEQFGNHLALLLLRDKMRDEDNTIDENEAQAIAENYAASGVNIDPRNLIGKRRSGAINLLPKPIFNPITGQVEIMAPRTQIAMPPGAADASQIIEKAKSFTALIDKYEGFLNEVPSGRILGTGADYINRLTGAFPKVAAIRGLAPIMTVQIARFIAGDVGNLNENEQSRAAQALGQINGTDIERRQAIVILREIVQDVKNREQKRLQFGSAAIIQPSDDGRPVQERILKDGTRVRVRQHPNGKWEVVE